MKTIKLDGCISLESIDAAENSLRISTFPYLPNLINLSLKENGQSGIKKITLNSPNLEFLDCSDSSIKEVKFVQPCPYSRKDEGYESDKEKNESEDAPTEWEQRAYERQQRKEKEDIANRKGVYEGMTELDFSHKNYTKMNLDGNIYPKSVTSINLGNNKLKWLRVANFPNLQRLITSHNKLTEENIIIENCPNLDKENLFYNHKSFDENIEEPTEEKEYTPEEVDDDNIQNSLFTKQIEEILAKNEDDITIEELFDLANKIDISALIDHELRDKFITLYSKKLEAERIRIFQKQKDKKDDNPDFEKLYNELLKRIKQGKLVSRKEIENSPLNEEYKQKLYNLLEERQSKQTTLHNPNYDLWICLGIGGIFIIGLVSFVWYRKRKQKSCVSLLF